MAINTYLSILILHVNELHHPIKIYRVAECIYFLKDIYIVPTRDSL